MSKGKIIGLIVGAIAVVGAAIATLVFVKGACGDNGDCEDDWDDDFDDDGDDFKDASDESNEGEVEVEEVKEDENTKPVENKNTYGDEVLDDTEDTNTVD